MILQFEGVMLVIDVIAVCKGNWELKKLVVLVYTQFTPLYVQL